MGLELQTGSGRGMETIFACGGCRGGLQKRSDEKSEKRNSKTSKSATCLRRVAGYMEKLRVAGYQENILPELVEI